MILDFLPITPLAAANIKGLLDRVDALVSQVLEVVNDAIFFSIGGMPIPWGILYLADEIC